MTWLEQTINELQDSDLSALNDYLRSFVSPKRQQKILDTLSLRTRKLTVVLENVYRIHNASAVIRNCECFGVQDLHIIEAGNRFETNTGISQGAGKWITVQTYRQEGATEACLAGLRSKGYKLAAMTLEQGAVPIDQLPLDSPLAVCFGSEEPGLSSTAHGLADYRASIPMYGFTQSLNLSVSVGIALQRLRDRMERSPDFQIPADELFRLETLWLAKSISANRALLKRWLNDR